MLRNIGSRRLQIDNDSFSLDLESGTRQAERGSMAAHRDLGTLRLASQCIAVDNHATPEDVVRWMGALQAQDYMQAVWAVGLRTRSATLADVEQALEDARIVRTWPMRGTLHFVPPEDARWMLALSAARMLAADGRRMAQLELTTDIIVRCQDVFCGALSGGKRLSRPAMMNLLEEAGISTRGQRGYHILWYLAQSGVLCMGPMENKQQTFVLLDEWAPTARDLPREEALAELARRYFTSHGPATVHDFAWWAGITLTDARQGLAAAQAELVAETVEDNEYWRGADTPSPDEVTGPAIHLLPGYDEYLLGYKDRSAVLAAEHAQKIVPGNNGVFRALIVVAGQVVGTWQRKIKKKSVDVTLHPFIRLSHDDEQVIDAAQAYADFIGLPLSVTIMDAAD